MDNLNPNTINHCIKFFFDTRDYNHVFNEEKGYHSFQVYVEEADRTFSVNIKGADKYFTLYTALPMCVNTDNEKTVSSLSEYFGLVNVALSVGTFALDLERRMIRYYNCVKCNDKFVTSKIQKSIEAFKFDIACFSSGIAKIVFDGGDACGALEECINTLDEYIEANEKILAKLKKGGNSGSFNSSSGVPSKIKTNIFNNSNNGGNNS